MQQKKAAAVLQAKTSKIDAEVEKRKKHRVVLPPPSLAQPKSKTTKTDDVATDDDGVSLASAVSKGAKRQKKHTERAD